MFKQLLLATALFFVASPAFAGPPKHKNVKLAPDSMNGQLAPDSKNKKVKLAPDSMTINLNTATAAQLAQLPGIGAKKAAQIIAFRKATPFKSVADAIKVKGIGQKTVAKWAGKDTVK